MRLPIRARLTAWYVLLLALVLVGVGAFVVLRLRSDLGRDMEQLAAIARRLGIEIADPRLLPYARSQAVFSLLRAAQHYGVDVEEDSWRDLGKRPHTRNRAHD